MKYEIVLMFEMNLDDIFGKKKKNFEKYEKSIF